MSLHGIVPCTYSLLRDNVNRVSQIFWCLTSPALYCLWLIINTKGPWNLIILLLIYLHLHEISSAKNERHIHDIPYGKNWLLTNVRVKCLLVHVCILWIKSVLKPAHTLEDFTILKNVKQVSKVQFLCCRKKFFLNFIDIPFKFIEC